MSVNTNQKIFTGRRVGTFTMLMLFMTSLPLIAQAAESASSAVVTISGTVVGNTCETATGEAIDFGNINRTQFTNNLLKKAEKVKVVTLSNCGSAARNVKVTVTSYGANKSDSGSATGVTAVLFNDSTELKVNSKSAAIPLVAEGNNKKIELIPALRIDPSIFKEGKVTSDVALNIEYQ